ncbi:MAG: ABC transporter, partial [Syntrophobacterales bacterium CG03_land_8_20_14_0_80_58_14]
LLTNFIITPMAFLGGTFFPLERLPEWAQTILWALPLTHASGAIRATAFGQTPNYQAYLILLFIGALFFWFALRSVGRARD